MRICSQKDRQEMLKELTQNPFFPFSHFASLQRLMDQKDRRSP
jgi:hypothetical protein